MDINYNDTPDSHGDEFINFTYLEVDYKADDLMRCPGALLNSLYINFCNIHGLSTNFLSVERNLFSAKPHLLFLTETLISATTDSKP